MLEGLKRWLSGKPTAPRHASEDSGEVGAESALSEAGVLRLRPLDASEAIVVDVRSEREFHAAAIVGAINLPLPQVAHRISEVAPDPGTPLVLYCASGARSGMACVMLRQMGYANVTNAGGLYAAAAHLQRELRR